MIQIISGKRENTIAIKMSGEITENDYKVIIPVLEEKIRKYERINLYCEIENVEKIEPSAFWRDIKFDVKHLHDFERVALIGDKKWVKWMGDFSKPFTSAQIKYFDIDEKKEAHTWVEEKAPHHT